MLKLHYFAISLAIAIVFGSSGAWAAQCRATASVTNSAASVEANTLADGHVSIHIRGNPTEAGKSQFNSAANFTAAWANWAAYSGPKGPDPKICGGSGGTMMDCVGADVAGINAAYVCDTVNDAGNCTSGHNIVPVKVAFRYSKNRKGVWILNTAYPSVNDNCQ